MTLWMRDLENREIGEERGLAEGLAKGRAEGLAEVIPIFISVCRELDMPDMIILQKLMEKLGLTEEDAKNFLK